MKRKTLFISIGLLALVTGVAVLWLSSFFPQFFPLINNPSSNAATPVEAELDQQFVRERSGKVIINFRNFEYGKEWNANFEIINETAQPIFYVGSKRKDKFDYCILGVRHVEPFPANPDGKIENLSFRVRDSCYYGTFLALQILKPGESIVLAAEDHEVRDMLAIKDTEQRTTAEIGFEVFTGDEKRREILWSEEIMFPPDPYR